MKSRFNAERPSRSTNGFRIKWNRASLSYHSDSEPRWQRRRQSPSLFPDDKGMILVAKDVGGGGREGMGPAFWVVSVPCDQPSTASEADASAIPTVGDLGDTTWQSVAHVLRDEDHALVVWEQVGNGGFCCQLGLESLWVREASPETRVPEVDTHSTWMRRTKGLHIVNNHYRRTLCFH